MGLLRRSKKKLARHEPARRMEQKVQIALEVEEQLARLLASPRCQDPLRLSRHEFQVFSQAGEDGILEEIFNRVGTTNRTFIEFGTGDGTQSNGTYLLLKGWNGFWWEAVSESVQKIRRRFACVIDKGSLHVQDGFLLPENIERQFADAGVPKEPDLLSIDIDGNDYWVWQAVEAFRPRAVCIEYNSAIRPPTRWVMAYQPDKGWDGTNYHGASLKSLELLGAKKGYALVGCSLAGLNAFFVRQDLAAGKFCQPFTAENHYEPSRFHLIRQVGHPGGFGPFESI